MATLFIKFADGAPDAAIRDIYQDGVKVFSEVANPARVVTQLATDGPNLLIELNGPTGTCLYAATVGANPDTLLIPVPTLSASAAWLP